MHLRDYTVWPHLTRLGSEILVLVTIGTGIGCAIGIPIGVALALILF